LPGSIEVTLDVNVFLLTSELVELLGEMGEYFIIR
jgi:hypothetical protein